jgi:hypothetical protein
MIPSASNHDLSSQHALMLQSDSPGARGAPMWSSDRRRWAWMEAYFDISTALQDILEARLCMQLSPKFYGILLNIVGMSTILNEVTRWFLPLRPIQVATEWAFALAHIALAIPFLLLGSILMIKITAARVGIMEGAALAYQHLSLTARIIFIISLVIYGVSIFFGVAGDIFRAAFRSSF